MTGSVFLFLTGQSIRMQFHNQMASLRKVVGTGANI